jgi:oligopeptide transport system permease protein
MEDVKTNKIPAEKFTFVQADKTITDKKLETKPVGYFRDAARRFAKNKASVVSFFIIVAMLLFAVCTLLFSVYPSTYQNSYGNNLLPKVALFENAGFWDGAKNTTVSQANYYRYKATYVETGRNPIKRDYGKNDQGSYDIRLDSYLSENTGYAFIDLSLSDYKAIQTYQNETGNQVIFPAVYNSKYSAIYQQNPAYWYQMSTLGIPTLDKDGNFQDNYVRYTDKGYTQGADMYDSTRIASDDGTLMYAQVKANGIYRVRVLRLSYMTYTDGFEPVHAFGTNQFGQDIMVRLASGMLFSLLLGLVVSLINLTIGAIYGSIEGYYGGATDLIMERISDILSGIPFTVVAVLFQLHLAQSVGVVGSLLFAFVLTGWIGMASRVRTQFYRFKNQEYVLAARTLGAKDGRLMFKHIFPNSLGTIVTSAALSIPSIVFSESSLSYLGIINLNVGGITSLGTMLAGGQTYLANYPHIILFPALAISILMITFNLLGNGLRDAFNPTLRGSED